MSTRLVGSLLAATAAAAGVLLGCSTEPVDCRKGVTISVSAGTTPTFDWPGHCAARSLSAGGWYITSAGLQGDNIYPPVVYGTVPRDAEEQGPAPPLEAGKTYTVEIDRTNQLFGGVTTLGETTFTP